MLPFTSDSQCSCSIYPLCQYEDDLLVKRKSLKVRLQDSKQSLFVEGILGSIKSSHSAGFSNSRSGSPKQPKSPKAPSKSHNPKDLIAQSLEHWRTEREKYLECQKAEKERKRQIRLKQMTKSKSQYKELKRREELITERIRDTISACQSEAVSLEKEACKQEQQMNGHNHHNNKNIEKDQEKASYKAWNLLHRPMALLDITAMNETPDKIFAEAESAYANAMEGVRSSTSLDKIEITLNSMLKPRHTSNPQPPQFDRKVEALAQVPELIDNIDEEDEDTSSSIESYSRIPSASTSALVLAKFESVYNVPEIRLHEPKPLFPEVQAGPLPEFMADFDECEAELVTEEEAMQLYNYNYNEA